MRDIINYIEGVYSREKTGGVNTPCHLPEPQRIIVSMGHQSVKLLKEFKKLMITEEMKISADTKPLESYCHWKAKECNHE